jgi:hypothetical protein
VTETQFHARATYRHETALSIKVGLIVYSTGESARAFELHISVRAEPVCGGKGQIISDWRRENWKLRAEGFLLDSVNIVDHDFDL